MNTAQRSFSPVLFLLLTISGAGFVTYDVVDRLRTDRPASEQLPQELISDKLQNLPARLWMDPLASLNKGIPARAKNTEGEDGNNTTLTGKFRKIAEHLPPGNSEEECLALGVIINGRWYPEDIEQRIRFRHAIVAAMAKLHYAPCSSEYLGSVKFPASNGNSKGTIECPFELYTYSPPDSGSSSSTILPKSILLYWINEETLGDVSTSPIEPLETICSSLENGFKTLNMPFRRALIAAVGSDFLKRIGKPDDDPVNASQSIPLLACCATAEMGSDWTVEPQSPNTSEQFTKGDFRITRTIGKDSALAEALVKELKCRRIVPGAESYPMVLISEFDTLYGRELPNSLITEIENKSTKETTEEKEKKKKKELILCFKYFRGLDGLQPLRNTFAEGSISGAPQNDKGTSNILENWTGKTPLDVPVGTSQYDYIRRIGGILFEYQKYLRREFGSEHGTIRSIGVLGSDVYDKLLLLQALRPMFPEAMFFTTDLDALYLHPSHNSVCRGMAIVSHYGLNWQGTYGLSCVQNMGWERLDLLSSFRDCYQTSCYRSTILAICNDEEAVMKLDAPEVFEVGRTRFIECKPPSSDNSAKTSTRTARADSASNASEPAQRFSLLSKLYDGFYHLTEENGMFAVFPLYFSDPVLNKRPEVTTASRIYFILFSLLVLVYGLSWILATRFWRELFPNNPMACRVHIPAVRMRSQTLIFLFFLPLLWGIFTFLCFRLSWQEPGAEHVYAWEGISAWPRIHLQILAIILCVFFIGRIRMALSCSNNSIKNAPFFNNDAAAKSDEAAAQNDSSESAGKTMSEKRDVRLGRIGWLLRIPSKYKAFVSKGTLLQVARECMDKHDCSAQDFWNAYLFYDGTWPRLIRILPWCLFMLLAWAWASPYPWQEFVSAHIRSASLQKTALWIQLLAYLSLAVLTLSVLDVVGLCRRFVEAIVLHDLKWHYKKDLQRKRRGTGQKTDIPSSEKDGDEEWVAMELITRRTQVVQGFIYYPFIVLLVLWLSTNNLFETYSSPRLITMLFVIPAVLTFFAVWILRRAAEQARQNLLAQLHDQQIHCRLLIDTNADHSQDRQLSNLEEIADRIEKCNTGAFSSWAENPLLGSLLLPFGGAGAIQLFEYILRVIQ